MLAGLFVAAMAALPFVLGANWVNTLTRAWISSLAVFSINLLTGVAGLLSFGQAGFVGLGAYTYGVLAVRACRRCWPSERRCCVRPRSGFCSPFRPPG